MAGLRFLLDSNILSEPSRPRPDAGVQSRLRSHRHEVCTAAPILHELHYGLARMPEGARKQQLTRYLDQVLRQLPAILPYDREAALWHAGERARLTSRGRTPPYADGQNRRDCKDERLDLDHPQHRRLCRFCQSESGELVRVTAQQEWKRFACNEGSSELGSPSSHAMPSFRRASARSSALHPPPRRQRTASPRSHQTGSNRTPRYFAGHPVRWDISPILSENVMSEGIKIWAIGGSSEEIIVHGTQEPDRH